MPKDIPEPLRPVAMAIKETIDSLPKLPNGMPDLSKAPADLKVRVEQFKEAYEKATGHTLPPFPPPMPARK